MIGASPVTEQLRSIPHCELRTYSSFSGVALLHMCFPEGRGVDMIEDRSYARLQV